MPSATVIACRSCGQKLRVPADRRTDAGRCPKCGLTFPPVGAVRWPRLRRWTGRLVVAYAGLVTAALLLLWGVGEAWGPATLLLYAPRWAVLLPGLPVGVLAVIAHRKAGVGLLMAGVVWVVAGAGFQLAGATAPRLAPAGGVVVLTWNTNGPIRRPAAFQDLLTETAPDVVLLQECPDFDAGELGVPGWNVARSRDGLLAASPHPLRRLADLPAGAFRRPGTAAVFEVDLSGGPVRMMSVHLPTPRPGIEAVLGNRLRNFADLEAVTTDLDHASAAARAFADGDPGPTVVAGDFNLPGESQIFRRHWGDWKDAFAAAGFGFGHTKETRWHGARIDHVLHTAAWDCRWCQVRPALGSDHCPLVAHLARSGP
jgi:vancomycin resistance protein VanJ